MAAPQSGVPRTFGDPKKPRYRNYHPRGTVNKKDRASVLIYLQDIPVNATFPRTGVLNRIPEELHQYINYAPIGLEFQDGRVATNIFGNDAAHELLAEFDSVIEFSNNGSQWIHDTLTEAFGRDAFRGLTLPEMLSLVKGWCHGWFTARNRFIEFGMNHCVSVWQRPEVYAANRQRTDIANEVLHAPNIEFDAVWVCVPNVNVTAEVGRNTRGMTNAGFRALYRLNRIEAIAIMRIAKQKSRDGTSTRYGRLFRWIVYFINQYTKWKVTVYEQYCMMSQRSYDDHAAKKNFQTQEWDKHGGKTIEGSTNLPPRGFRLGSGLAGRPEHRDFTGNTIMDINSQDFTYEVTTVLPTTLPIGQRHLMRADPAWCLETLPIYASPRPIPVPRAPAQAFNDSVDPSDTYVAAAMAQVVTQSDDEVSSQDYDEEEEPPYSIEIQDGVGQKRSLTALKGRTARLTTSALLRNALWSAGSLKRPARTPLRSVFSGRVAKRRKINEPIAPAAAEEE
ncbi:hypothetical protein F5Y00DRAFT_262348 [Daldinia vernicosa]|uniref:uncharacterized protein n=1 Tax=Daldinia vernicosa TaxID=114800 RepID=UPI00200740A1|nr:uncharacterized protein F5Y00DRAFT_262348 [Daldinia vernicosa]KAI0848561.1 hypothetical protein F5Y00DRAFT_262348 [Daldinia vernicosa]